MESGRFRDGLYRHVSRFRAILHQASLPFACHRALAQHRRVTLKDLQLDVGKRTSSPLTDSYFSSCLGSHSKYSTGEKKMRSLPAATMPNVFTIEYVYFSTVKPGFELSLPNFAQLLTREAASYWQCQSYIFR